MKTYSPTQLETYQTMGRKLRVNFNEQIVEAKDADSIEQYKYDTAEVDKLADRATIVEAIMQTKYPTFGSELAAIRNGGSEVEEHESLRIKAKSLADGWLTRES